MDTDAFSTEIVYRPYRVFEGEGKKRYYKKKGKRIPVKGKIPVKKIKRITSNIKTGNVQRSLQGYFKNSLNTINKVRDINTTTQYIGTINSATRELKESVDKQRSDLDEMDKLLQKVKEGSKIADLSGLLSKPEANKFYKDLENDPANRGKSKAELENIFLDKFPKHLADFDTKLKDEQKKIRDLEAKAAAEREKAEKEQAKLLGVIKKEKRQKQEIDEARRAQEEEHQAQLAELNRITALQKQQLDELKETNRIERNRHSKELKKLKNDVEKAKTKKEQLEAQAKLEEEKRIHAEELARQAEEKRIIEEKLAADLEKQKQIKELELAKMDIKTKKLTRKMSKEQSLMAKERATETKPGDKSTTFYQYAKDVGLTTIAPAPAVLDPDTTKNLTKEQKAAEKRRLAAANLKKAANEFKSKIRTDMIAFYKKKKEEDIARLKAELPEHEELKEDEIKRNLTFKDPSKVPSVPALEDIYQYFKDAKLEGRKEFKKKFLEDYIEPPKHQEIHDLKADFNDLLEKARTKYPGEITLQSEYDTGSGAKEGSADSGGLWNYELDYMLKPFVTQLKYLGTVPREQVGPLLKSVKGDKFSLIYNTSKSTDPPSYQKHWIALACFDGASIELYNPLGSGSKEPVHTDVMEAINEFGRDRDIFFKLKVNKLSDQNITYDTCGWHCVRYLLMRGIYKKSFAEASHYGTIKESEAGIERMKEEFGYV